MINSGLTIVHPVDRIREVVLLDWNRHREVKSAEVPTESGTMEVSETKVKESE